MALRAALRTRHSLSGFLSQTSSVSSGAHDAARMSPALVAQQRNNSTAPNIKVDFDQSIGVALIRLQRPPVNSFSLDFLTEFCITMEKLEMDNSCRGVIITSRQPRVFSAGLDLMDIYGKSHEHCAAFHNIIQEMWLKVYSSSMVTMSAINGSSPGGGCVMNIACDYRIMADDPKYRIGLNETQFGIIPSAWLQHNLKDLVGYRAADMCLQLGTLYNPSDALELGLVDQVVPEEDVLTTAIQTMNKWLAIPEHARQMTKTMMRKAAVDELMSGREAETEFYASMGSSSAFQKAIGAYLEKLKRRNS
ncbi:uncharacterized protein V6R79_013150 [Siganus canaliculatus]